MLDPIVTNLVPLAERGPWGPGPWMLVFPLLWIVVIVAAVWFFRSRGWARPSSGPSANEILDRLFAEGSVSAEEYRARRQVLAGKE
jgi:putative membrane protein